MKKVIIYLYIYYLNLLQELVHQGRLIASEVDDERIGDAAVRLKESEVVSIYTYIYIYIYIGWKLYLKYCKFLTLDETTKRFYE